MRSIPWVLACLALAACAAGDAQNRLSARLDALISSRAGDRTLVSVLAVDARTGDPLLSRAPGLLLHPGSCQKLLTVAAFLADPVDRELSTVLRLLPGGVIVLQGGGDPLLSVADLAGLAARARSVLPDAVRLRADATIFPGPPLGTGWMWDDERFPFLPRVTGLTVGRGVVEVSVRGTAPFGSREVRPRAAVVQVVPDTERERQPDADGYVSLTRGTPGSAPDAVLSWSLPEAPPVTRSISVARPGRLALRVLAAELEALGIRVAIDDAPEQPAGAPFGEVVARVDRPACDLLPAILSESDNLAAECLLRLLGVWATGSGTESAGLEVVDAYLARVVPEAARGRTVDGSGLSHYDLVTAREIVSVMQDLRRRPVAWERFSSALAEAGVSGTLADRPVAAGRLRGKTGTLSGVSTLAGLATRRDGRQILFAILVQNYVGSASPWRDLQDRICDILLAAPTRR